jgi:hypothetical protein
MIDLLNINTRKGSRLTSLLGLALDGTKLDGVVLRRTDGSLEVQQSFSVSLSLDPLTAATELVGREIRNHLDAAGIKERNCVVGLPLKWALTTSVEVPELPEADIDSFLQLEAERGFHCDIATLHFAASRSHSNAGKQHAFLVGIPKNHLALLEQALRAAKLKPLSFSLGITALLPPGAESSNGVLGLAIGETHVGLEVTSGGGVAALRALEGALEMDGSRRVLQSELVGREARITLGQLPAEVRETVRRIRIFGPRDLSQQLADELELKLEPMGLKVELAARYPAHEFGLHLPTETVVSAPLSLAAGQLVGRKPPFELLPPRVSTWQQMVNRYSSGKVQVAGAAAAALFLIVASAFGYQQWQLTKLRGQWQGMSSKAKELEGVTQQIHQYRPWFDDSLRALTILKELTTAFPEDGRVSAKSVEIRDLNTVTCTGITRDSESMFTIWENLRRSGNVRDLHRPTTRGNKPPLQFTFDFRWNEGGRSEN